MAIFGQWPWTNFHEMNLDWVIKTVKESLDDVTTVVASYFTAHVDNTLSVSGDAADAAKTGTEINNLKGRMTTAEGNITGLDGRVTALEGVTAAAHVYKFELYKSDNTLTYYDQAKTDSAASSAALIHDLDVGQPVIVLLDGIPVTIITFSAAGNGSVTFDGRDYRCVIPGNNSSGSAYFKRVRIMETGASYSVGNYSTLLQVIGREIDPFGNISVRTSGPSTTHAISSWSYDTGTGDITLTYASSTAVCHSDGTITIS